MGKADSCGGSIILPQVLLERQAKDTKLDTAVVSMYQV